MILQSALNISSTYKTVSPLLLIRLQPGKPIKGLTAKSMLIY